MTQGPPGDDLAEKLEGVQKQVEELAHNVELREREIESGYVTTKVLTIVGAACLAFGFAVGLVLGLLA